MQVVLYDINMKEQWLHRTIYILVFCNCMVSSTIWCNCCLMAIESYFVKIAIYIMNVLFKTLYYNRMGHSLEIDIHMKTAIINLVVAICYAKSNRQKVDSVLI